IEIRGLYKKHGSLEILRDLSLSVEKGEVAAIIGPSGGGKSTLLRCINGLESFEQGEIRVGDDRLTADMSHARRSALVASIRKRLGFVFQQFNLFPHLDVLGNVIEAPVQVLGKSKEEASALADELLGRVGMSHKKRAFPHELSGGQQQRVAIARAL